VLKDFRQFILRGNLVDLAVAVVIGAAFSSVVNAMVKNVLMPFIAGLVGSPNFDDFARWNFNGNMVEFGVLLTAVVNFLLIAAAIYFVIVMPMNKLIALRDRKVGIGRKDEAAPVDPQVALLTEIRDALKVRD
jgi:large conductance mechanosensitive channel